MGGNSSVTRRKEERERMVREVLAASENIPKPKPVPKPVDELPETVLRMTESLRMRGMSPENARAEAIRIYAKNRR
jgi:hypothetical protein